MTLDAVGELRPAFEKLKAESQAIAAELKGIRAQCGTVEENAGAQVGAIRTRVDQVEHRMRSLNSSIMIFYDELERLAPLPRPANDQGRKAGK